MKIAILSDIHGNIPALLQVLEDLDRQHPDLVVLNGDIINRGPDSLEVVERLAQRLPEAHYIKGNHEAWILRCRQDLRPRSGIRFETKRFAYWTLDQLGDTVARIEPWHDELDLCTHSGGEIHFTHGSRLGNRDGLHPKTEERDLAAKLGDRRDLFIASHTHIPMIRHYQDTLIVNSGSVGAPFDRDPRASYALVSRLHNRWEAEIRRIPYPREATEARYQESGFLHGGGPLTRLMLRELQLSRGLLGLWMRSYQPAVLAQQITLEKSVEKILEEVG